MLHLYDRATIAEALKRDLDPQLRRLLVERIKHLSAELIDQTEFAVIQSGDTEAEIVRHVGFSPLIEPIEGARYGEQGFHPFFDLLVDRDGYFELIVTFGSTFAYVLLIEDDAGIPDGLRSLCREFCSPA